jgi:starvation-inducible outer membrane lipoprotein
MLAHLKHRVILAALFAAGLTLGACATEPNGSEDGQATPERKLMPVKAKPEQRAVHQVQVRGAEKAAAQLKAGLQLRAYRAR